MTMNETGIKIKPLKELHDTKLSPLSKELAKNMTTAILDEIKSFMEQTKVRGTSYVPDAITTTATRRIAICYVIERNPKTGKPRTTYTFYNLGLANLMADIGKQYNNKYVNSDAYDVYAVFSMSNFGDAIKALLPKKLTGTPKIGKQGDATNFIYSTVNNFVALNNIEVARVVKARKSASTPCQEDRLC